jgi:hypothetical protein
MKVEDRLHKDRSFDKALKQHEGEVDRGKQKKIPNYRCLGRPQFIHFSFNFGKICQNHPIIWLCRKGNKCVLCTDIKSVKGSAQHSNIL